MTKSRVENSGNHRPDNKNVEKPQPDNQVTDNRVNYIALVCNNQTMFLLLFFC